MALGNTKKRSHRSRLRRAEFALFTLLLGALLLAGASGLSSPGAEEPRDKGPARAPLTIVDLQPSRQESSMKIQSARGEEGLATLTNLNPHSNVWYLLRLKWAKGPEELYHLENGYPQTQKFALIAGHPRGLVIVTGREQTPCELWEFDSRSSLLAARKSGKTYAPLCGGKLYLRNFAKGHRTAIELVTDILRDEVPGGEKIVTFVRDTFFKEAYRERAGQTSISQPAGGELPSKRAENGPSPALMDPGQPARLAKASHLGIAIREGGGGNLVLGEWVEAKETPGAFVSLIQPEIIAPEILRSYKNRVSPLDRVEAEGLVYLMAFDLDRFDLRFSLGTDHPRLGWSEHTLSQVRDPSRPGPDGIESAAPLVRTGLISPRDAARTVAAFTGGFKRTHGAFRFGALALKNRGSHYGFIEEGVVFSRLQPGLATVYGEPAGRVEMKTWSEADDAALPGIKFARQSGVPLVDGLDPASRTPVPGPLVAQWGPGNWSGSEDKKLRTLRAGLGLQEIRGRRFLLYAFFWSATPSAMARVFQAYQCRYAMLTDMNALEHTYLALYQRQGSTLLVQHLIQGMNEVDRTSKGVYIPRFLGYADNRDFFYLLRKEGP